MASRTRLFPRKENETLEILSPINEDEIKTIREIRFGRIRVDENGEELGLLDRDLT